MCGQEDGDLIISAIDISTERFKSLDKLNLVKFAYGGLVLGSSQFLLLHQLPIKIMLASKETHI